MTIRIPVANKPNQTFKDKKKYDRKKYKYNKKDVLHEGRSGN